MVSSHWARYTCKVLKRPVRRVSPVSYTHLDVYKRQLFVTPEQALTVTKVLDAIYESARTGKTIYFD